MKHLQIIHAIATLLLVAAVVGYGILLLTGTLEVPIVTKSPANARRGAEANAGGSINPATRKAQLVVIRGAKPGMEYPIFEGRNVIGRADQEPVEIDLEIQEEPKRIWSSRQHAVLTWKNGILRVEDLNSSNGTYVNRRRVPPGQKRELKTNDIIQIGEVQLQFRF